MYAAPHGAASAPLNRHMETNRSKWTPPRWLSIVARSWQLVASVALLLLLVELTCRACAQQPAGGARNAKASDVVRYALHPYLQTVNSADVDVDKGPDFAGFRIDPPDAAFAPERLRILFLGGSTTATTYPNHVRRMLEPELGPITVYNLGVEWYCTLHSLFQIWTYADRIKPDLVVILHNVNDFCRGFTPPEFSLPEYREDFSHYAGALSMFWWAGVADADGRPSFVSETRLKNLRANLSRVRRDLPTLIKEESAILSLLRREPTTREERVARARAQKRDESDVIREKMPEEVVLRSLPAFERYMLALRKSCEVNALPVLFLTMPFDEHTATPTMLPVGCMFSNDGVHYLTPDDFAFGMKRFNEVVRGVAGPSGVTVLDLEALVVDKSVFIDEVHLTPAGDELQARFVSDFIRTRGLLKRR